MQLGSAEQEKVRPLVGNHDSGSGAIAQFVEYLLSIHETLGSFLQHHLKTAMVTETCYPTVQ